MLKRPLLTVALVLSLVAGGFAVWGGWSWYGAAHDDTASFAAARDEALESGEQAVQNLNTLDHQKLAGGLDLWESSTTGALHSQLVKGRPEFEKQVRSAKTVSTAKVLDGAVTELDERAGKARVMVALRITVKAAGQKATDKDSRMLGELTRTDGHWKLSALAQAQVGDSASTTTD
ncbi:nuclear transport factor 2 family protein [Streptomyces sp. NPDC088785]|uniref:nuclear transport factor 2 family protein n=1 Tax=Streptomyces sp. NPDC088785 TaxID=3365897 RepID=UPI0037F975F3